MRLRKPVFVLWALLLCACAAAQRPHLPAGAGLVSFDREAPASAERFERPSWRVGDRFVWRQGESLRLAERVASADESGYELIDELDGARTRFNLDLAELGWTPAAGSEAESRELDPYDAVLSWPMWVGKRWVSQFTRRAQSGDVPILATYVCDLLEEVQVPAGSFLALRIWRRTRPASPGTFVERTTLLWYAPAAGCFVRRLDDGLLTELCEFQRQ
jgi:hypothetical protein